MKVQEATSTIGNELKESALSGWIREGSTPVQDMSAIRINIEKASDDGRGDFVRDVSPLRVITLIR